MAPFVRSRSVMGRKPRARRFSRTPNNVAFDPFTDLPAYAAFGAGSLNPNWFPTSLYLDPDRGARFPGTTGNFLSTPDAAALDITGDITLLAVLSLDNWVPPVINTIVTKSAFGSSAYAMAIDTAGRPYIATSPDGTNLVTWTAANPIGAANGRTVGIAITLDVNNGASGRDYKLWTSNDDGVTWTLAQSATESGTTSIIANSTILEIGSILSGNGLNLAGWLRKVEVWSGAGFTTNGPTGTCVFSDDLRRKNTATHVAGTGQTVTTTATAAQAAILTMGTLKNSGAYTDPTNGLVLPGVNGNHASVSDSAALSITGDITYVVQVAMNDWTPSATSRLGSKWNSAGNQRGWGLYLQTNGALGWQWSNDGSTTVGSITSSAFLNGYANGAELYVAVAHDVDNGAAGNDIRFWTSTDGATWAQLGTTQTQVGTTSIYDNTADLLVGALGSAGGTESCAGAFKRAWVYSGSGFSAAGPSGALVLDIDFRRPTTNAFVCSTGQTVTINSTFNAVQATAASRPTLTTSSLLNDVDVWDFDGTDDRADILSGVSLAQPFEVWWIGTFDTVGATRAIAGLSSVDNARRFGVTGTPNHIINMGTGLVGGTPAANTAYARRDVVNGASSSITVNGASVASGNANTNGVDQIILGAGRTAPSTYAYFQDGKTALLLIIPSASITQQMRTRMGQWAADKCANPAFVGAFG